MRNRRGYEAYDADADRFVERYESLRFEDVHTTLRDLVPATPGRVLDVGAGSGRDAAALAALGHEVVAVEPSSEMRRRARQLHPDAGIWWLDDSLPDLSLVRRLGTEFDLALLSAVWMHVAPRDQERAFANLASLLVKDGVLALTLRMGPAAPARRMYEVSAEELLRQGQERGLHIVRLTHDEDRLRRPEVTWIHVAFRRPARESTELETAQGE